MKIHYLLIILLLAAHNASAEDQQDVVVVLVQPAGELFSEQEQYNAVKGIDNAYLFWKRNGYAKSVNVVTVAIQQPINNPYSTILSQWAAPQLIDRNPITTIYVVDNENSAALLFGKYAGYSQEYYNIIVVVLYPLGENQMEYESLVAHELGHNLFDLPDLYNQMCAYDIMCRSSDAYAAGFIGCQSSAYLGKPCTKLFLPGVQYDYSQ